ncbi:DUF4830 domain-containing protein [Firmicutes bacterium AM55-24TS]|jgi:hypothetical protein|nr:DUF4830 domain-containing protein [Firmicutes bacterium AM55-24TS]RHP05273.1 DUF4830 domain-containing protein [Firmicutes bacterium AF36-3BH]HBZ13316.1 hypothetical protein [Clostridiales bacterium]
MGRKAMMYFISVVIIIVTTLMFVLFASGETDTNNIVFLKGYGWEVRTKSVEKEDIIIPKPFDRVYENYNDIQLKAGLDLRPYMGMKGVRYTYIVENYPKDVGEEVRANVICINNEPVGGDIMTVSIRGFIHSLNFDDSLR